MKRMGAAALALLYALPATWALQGGIDLVRPSRIAADPDGKCAPHGCGCEESAKVRDACCCASVPGAPAPASALEASRCSGAEAAALTLLTPPALADRSLDLPIVLVSRIDLPEADSLQPEIADRTDKVPIA